jgi:dienelactone hydrolase
LLILAVSVIAALILLPDTLRAIALVSRASNPRASWIAALGRWQTSPVEVSDLQVPSRYGPLRARLYRPREPRGHPVVLTTGVHADGIEEPRLVKLAHDLATGGQVILTPEPTDLLRYEITPRLTDMIEDTATWLSGQKELAPDGKVSLFGISFSGGLSVAAAGRPALENKVAATLSLGGHGELSRVLSFLCTGTLPNGQHLKPHDYGVVVILLNVADRLVPPEQVEPLRAGIRTFLRASHLTLSDARRAEETFEEARQQQRQLPEPAATLMGYVNTRDVAALGPVLLPHVQAFAADPSVSPERSPPPKSPVYLLHGADDTVIPAIESSLLAQALRPHTKVYLLPTPLITHAEFDRSASVTDVWNLVSFWANLLDE